MRTDPRPKGGARPADIPAPRPAGSPPPAGSTAYANAVSPADIPAPRPAGSPPPAGSPAPANAVSPAGGTAYANAVSPAGGSAPANAARPAGSPAPAGSPVPANAVSPAGSTTYANAVSPAGGSAPANAASSAASTAPANAAPPPPVSPIRQVLWDWNGTLLDDLTYAIGVRNRTFPAFGLPRIGSVAEYHRQFTFPVRRYYERAGVTDETFVAVAHAWMAEYVRGFEAVPLHGDAVETLARFAAAGVRQAVLSATRRDMLESQIARFPIRAYFTDVLGLSDIYARSKEAVGLDYLARCGVPAASTLMIGDTLHDAEVARAMGTGCVLVARGHQSRETLLTAGVPVMDTLLEAAAWAGC
ncbi:MAG: HAD hydrolase-like protein [Christensenellales bacterium]